MHKKERKKKKTHQKDFKIFGKSRKLGYSKKSTKYQLLAFFLSPSLSQSLCFSISTARPFIIIHIPFVILLLFGTDITSYIQFIQNVQNPIETNVKFVQYKQFFGVNIPKYQHFKMNTRHFQ